MRSNILTIEESIKKIDNGCKIAIGGSILGDHPMGLVRALIRSKVKNITVQTILGGLDIDLLVGSDCIKRVEAAYVGFGPLGLAPNFRRFVQQGKIEMIDFSEVSMLARFRAAALGMPVMVVRSILGTDIMKNKDYVKVINCPFTNIPLALVSAATPDFALLHVAECDEFGNVRRPKSQSNPNSDEWLAAAANHIILSTEEIIPHSLVLREPYNTWISAKKVRAVVLIQRGAHPCSCNGRYKTDNNHINTYLEASKNEDNFNYYLSKFVIGCKSNEEYLKLVKEG